MIGCNEECIKNACCDVCIHAKHEEWIEIPKDGYEPQRVIGGPIGCNLHKELKYQLIAEDCGICEDFHCMVAKKPDYWIEVSFDEYTRLRQSN